MTTSERPGPKPPGSVSAAPIARGLLSVFTLLALAVLIGLGVWQLQRLQWKEALLAEMAAAQGAPAVPLVGALAAIDRGEAPRFRRVVGDCPDPAGRPHLELHAIEDGVVGRRWISACGLAEGPYRAILVDRGFVPQDASPASTSNSGSQAVVGFLRAEEPPTRFSPPPSPDDGGRTVWYRRDVAAMSAALGLREAAPVFLMLESPPPPGGLPRPAPLPTRVSNNHLGYAITWFGLAAALVGVYLGMMLKKRVRA